jgi:hypothetical protein
MICLVTAGMTPLTVTTDDKKYTVFGYGVSYGQRHSICLFESHEEMPPGSPVFVRSTAKPKPLRQRRYPFIAGGVLDGLRIWCGGGAP